VFHAKGSKASVALCWTCPTALDHSMYGIPRDVSILLGSTAYSSYSIEVPFEPLSILCPDYLIAKIIDACGLTRVIVMNIRPISSVVKWAPCRR